jgi:hypothetical protein
MRVFTLVRQVVTELGYVHCHVHRRDGLDVSTTVRPSLHDTPAFGDGRLFDHWGVGTSTAEFLIQVAFLGTVVMICLLVRNNGFQLNNATPDEWVVDLRVLLPTKP